MRHQILLVVATLAACSTDTMETSEAWPFADAPNTAVFSTKRVTAGAEPILFVGHDADDGAWQFLGTEELTEEAASVVALSTIVKIDDSVCSLADLPLGWYAQRSSESEAWRRTKSE